jgi:succinate dehydrogenase / fumarate reductase, cytochrome b subunit
MSSSRPPVFLNLLHIYLPLSALVSVLHRISGGILVLGLPVLLWGVYHALASAQQFAMVVGLLEYRVVRVVLALLGWSLGHHVVAGIRLLLLDVEIGMSLHIANLSARVVLGISMTMLVVLLGISLW